MVANTEVHSRDTGLRGPDDNKTGIPLCGEAPLNEPRWGSMRKSSELPRIRRSKASKLDNTVQHKFRTVASTFICHGYRPGLFNKEKPEPQHSCAGQASDSLKMLAARRVPQSARGAQVEPANHHQALLAPRHRSIRGVLLIIDDLGMSNLLPLTAAKSCWKSSCAATSEPILCWPPTGRWKTGASWCAQVIASLFEPRHQTGPLLQNIRLCGCRRARLGPTHSECEPSKFRTATVKFGTAYSGCDRKSATALCDSSSVRIRASTLGKFAAFSASRANARFSASSRFI